MSKRVMLSGYYGFENFGDDLILEVLVQQLRAINVEPIVLSDNPIKTMRTLEVESIQRTEVPAIWKKTQEIDSFISGGGGLFQDVTGPISPIYYGGLIEMARWRKRPVAFFGQGVGPLRTMLGRFMTRRALKQSELIIVRDVKSQALVHQLCEKKAHLMADPVWLWRPDPAFRNISQQGLGVSLRPWLHLPPKSIDHLAQCIAQLPTLQEVGVNLIDCQAGVDIVPLSRLEQTLKELGIPCRWFSEDYIVQGIAQSSAVIGMRFHALLVAARMGKPLIALSYDPKVQLLAAQLKIQDYPVAALEAMTMDGIRQCLRFPDTEVIAEFEKSALRGFSQLKSWLGC